MLGYHISVIKSLYNSLFTPINTVKEYALTNNLRTIRGEEAFNPPCYHMPRACPSQAGNRLFSWLVTNCCKREIVYIFKNFILFELETSARPVCSHWANFSLRLPGAHSSYLVYFFGARAVDQVRIHVYSL